MPLSHDAAQQLLNGSEQRWPRWGLAKVGQPTWTCEGVGLSQRDNSVLLDAGETLFGLWVGEIVLTVLSDADGDPSYPGGTEAGVIVSKIAAGVGTLLVTDRRMVGTVASGEHLVGPIETVNNPEGVGLAFRCDPGEVTKVEFEPPKGLLRKTLALVTVSSKGEAHHGVLSFRPEEDVAKQRAASPAQVIDAIRRAVTGAGGVTGD